MASKSKPTWDKAPRRVRREAKIKNLPAEDQETLYLLRNPTDETVKGYTIEEAMVYLQEEHRITCAISTFSEWESWYVIRQRIAAAIEEAHQAKEDFRAQNPDASLEDMEAMGQFVFTAETIRNRDTLNFTRLRKLSLQDRNADQKDQALAQKDREIRQKDEIIDQNNRRLTILESNERRKQETEDAIKAINSNGSLTGEEQRRMVLDKMDEFFGLKKIK